MGAIEVVKTAYDLAKSLGNLELQRQMIVVQEKVLQLQQENDELKKRASDLQDWETTKKSLALEANAYWIEKDEKKRGPFCTACADSKKQLVQMHVWANKEGAECPVCKVKLRFIPLRVNQDEDLRFTW